VSLLLALTGSVSAVELTNLTGQWEGHVQFTTVQPELQVKLDSDGDGSLTGSISLPQQDKYDIPLKDIVVDGDKVSFVLSTDRASASFAGTYSKDTQIISGDFVQAGQTYPFQLKEKNISRTLVE